MKVVIDIKNKFRKLLKAVIRRLRIWRYLIIAFFIILLILLGALTKSYLQGGKMAVIQSPLGKMILTPYRELRKSSDLFYLGYEFKKHDLATYRLELDPVDLEFLNNNLPEPFSGQRLTDEYRKLVPATFYHNDKEYKVKVRYRGWVSNHWANAKKSWDIKFDKDNPFFGLKGLKLIIPEDRGIVVENYNNYRSKKMGLYPMFDSFVVLEVNGENNGVYFQLEPWDSKYLAKHELIDETDMFTFDKDWHRYDRDPNLIQSIEYFDKQEDNPFDSNKDYSPVIKLVDLINNASDEEFKKEIGSVLDVDSFLAWQAHYALSSSIHNGLDNLRFFTDRETGKLVFAPWDVNLYDPDPQLEKATFSLYNRMSLIPEFAHRKNKILWDYVSDKDNLKDDLEFYDNAFASIKVALAQDHLKLNSTRWFINENKRLREKIITNFDNVKSVLSDSRAAIVIYTQNNQPTHFDIGVDTLSGVILKGVKLTTDEDEKIDARIIFDSNFNGQLDASDSVVEKMTMSAKKEMSDIPLNIDFIYSSKQYRFFIDNKDLTITDIDIKVRNAVTGKKIDKKIQYSNTDNYKYLYLKKLSVNEFLKVYPIFRIVNDNKVILPFGNYTIAQDIIIGENIELTISPGTSIRLMPGVSIISYGSVQAVGTVSSPINFSSATSQPWGVLAINEGNKTSNFINAMFTNGSDAHINGVYYSGMLSAYRSDVVIENSQFISAQADDGLNIKTAKAKVTNSIFQNNSADAIDFDFIKEGQISNNKFYSNGDDSIDISGSSILIDNNYIENSGDKCISVGERSLETIIYNNVLNKCSIGLEIKDLSDVKIINNVIVGNSIGINAYQKKELFGGGKASVYNSILWNNEIDLKTDSKSVLSIYSSNLKDSDDKNGNFSTPPTLNKNFTNNPKNGNILFISGGNIVILEDKLGLKADQVAVGLNQ